MCWWFDSILRHYYIMKSHIIFFLLKLKNASLYKKEVVIIDFKQDYIPILQLLYKEGYIQTFLINKDLSKNKSIITIYIKR